MIKQLKNIIYMKNYVKRVLICLRKKKIIYKPMIQNGLKNASILLRTSLKVKQKLKYSFMVQYLKEKAH